MCGLRAGCVQFLDEKDARAAGLAGVNAAGQVYMRTDNTTLDPKDSGGRTARKSIRVSSKRAYDPKTLSGGKNESGKVMFVLDVAHMPTGLSLPLSLAASLYLSLPFSRCDLAHMPTGCATWPSWWMNSVLGQWPEQGEIDLIEVRQSAHRRCQLAANAAASQRSLIGRS